MDSFKLSTDMVPGSSSQNAHQTRWSDSLLLNCSRVKDLPTGGFDQASNVRHSDVGRARRLPLRRDPGEREGRAQAEGRLQLTVLCRNQDQPRFSTQESGQSANSDPSLL